MSAKRKYEDDAATEPSSPSSSEVLSSTVSEASFDDPSRDPIQALVEIASVARLRELVLELAERNINDRDHIMDRISDDLLVPSPAVNSQNGNDSRKKPKLDDKLTCVGCEKEYRASQNRLGICSHFRHHPNHDVEQDHSDDFWADTDDYEMQPFDACPEGYIFTCCERKGTAAGCKRYMHVPK